MLLWRTTTILQHMVDIQYKQNAAIELCHKNITWYTCTMDSHRALPSLHTMAQHTYTHTHTHTRARACAFILRIVHLHTPMRRHTYIRTNTTWVPLKALLRSADLSLLSLTALTSDSNVRSTTGFFFRSSQTMTTNKTTARAGHKEHYHTHAATPVKLNPHHTI